MPTNPITGRFTEVILDTHEIAWAAGFFDGEGCTTCNGKLENKNPTLCVIISQVYKPNLYRFKKAVLGLGSVHERSNRTTNEYKVSTFERSQAVISLLWKYLSGDKKAQYKRTLKYYMENYDKQIKLNQTTKLFNGERIPIKSYYVKLRKEAEAEFNAREE